jgi:hypothetical protein
MKRLTAILLIVLLTVAFAACGSEREPVSKMVKTTIGGQEMTVKFEPGNISAGTIESAKGRYTFAYDHSGSLKITYPDGSSCTYRKAQNAGSVSASLDFNPTSKGYPDGMTMAWGIEHAMDLAQGGPKRNGGPNPLIAIFLLAVGAFNALAPRAAWYLSRGWQFKNAEPSDAALTLYAMGGVILLIAGVICLLAAIF